MVNEDTINKLVKAISTILDNGDRLIDDARCLYENERFPTSYALCILAQEEYAKAFLLYLISEGAIPWTQEVRRMLHDHTCKQLLSLIIDFLEPDDFFDWLNKRKDDNYKMPSHIADTINILRHEKFSRQGEWAWIGDDEPPCNKLARKVADGIIDKQKQDAIYVRIGKDGKIASTPLNITDKMVSELLEKSERFSRFIIKSNGKLKPIESIDFLKIFWTFRLLFGFCTVEEYNNQWGV